MIFFLSLNVTGILVALVILAGNVWILYAAAPDLLPSDAWLIAILNLLAHWAFVWEVMSFCCFVNNYETTISMMAVPSVSYPPSPISFNKEEEREDNIASCQKRIKEVLNQSLIESNDSENSGSGKLTQKSLSTSNNIAIKFSELSLKSDDTLLDSTSVEETTENIPVKSLRKGSSSRATPKQVYPNIACLPLEDNIIYCFLLSVWDNIVGPQTVYVWKKKTKLRKLKSYTYTPRSSFDDERRESNCSDKYGCSVAGASCSTFKKDISYQCKRTLCRTHSTRDKDSKCTNKSINDESICKKQKLCISTVVAYVTEHVVAVGESCRWIGNKMVFFLLTVPQQNIIILSVRFLIMEDGVGVPYCLSAVIPLHDESEMLPLIELIKEAMYRITAKARLLITKEGLIGGDKIRGDLLELCGTVSSLNRASLSSYNLGTLARMPDDRRFAEKMLTSHLQTMGTSIVIANSPHEANRVVMWLGQFLSEEDASTSRISLSDGLWPFQPGVSVQAVVRDSNGSIDLSSSKLLNSSRPLTLIDLTTSTVRQMAPMNAHAKNSSGALRMHLLALWHDLDQVPALSQSLFETVETSAPLVKRFLHEWDTLASCDLSVKKAYRVSFLRTLQYSALSVIMWAKQEWSKEKRRKDSKSILQAISSAFCLEEPDLKIILACAEKLEAGFLASLLHQAVKKKE